MIELCLEEAECGDSKQVASQHQLLIYPECLRHWEFALYLQSQWLYKLIVPSLA